jgi:hypothetical protein
VLDILDFRGANPQGNSPSPCSSAPDALVQAVHGSHSPLKGAGELVDESAPRAVTTAARTETMMMIFFIFITPFLFNG